MLVGTMEDSSETSIGETQSPNVREFVANFERRDSTSADKKLPVMTKSKVALLREAIGRTASDSDAGKVRRSVSASKAEENSLNSGDNVLNGHDRHEAMRGNSNLEGGLSVAKLKENLEKSAVRYGMRPIGGLRRSGKEPKRDRNKDDDNNVELPSQTKDLMNTYERVNGNCCQENADDIRPHNDKDKNSNESDSSNELINKLNETSVEMSGFVKKKKVPKILPKPAPRNRTKPNDGSGLTDHANSVERPVTRPRNRCRTTDDAESGPVKLEQSLSVKNVGTSGERESNVQHENRLSPVGNYVDTRNPLKNYSTSNDNNNPTGLADESNCLDVNNKCISSDEEHVTKLSSVGDESSIVATVHNGSSKTNVDESEMPSSFEEVRNVESPTPDVAITPHSEENVDCRVVDSVSIPSNHDVQSTDFFLAFVKESEPFSNESNHLPKKSLSDNNNVDTTSVLIPERNDVSFETDEEREYSSCAKVLGVKICDEGDESVKRLICPGDDFRSALYYVEPLYWEDVELNFKETKTCDESSEAEISSLSSQDLMRECLLDKATKKLESLKTERQKLDNWLLEQDSWQEEVNAIVKAKADAKQYDRFRSLVEELDKVMHLLLKLSSRLAIIDNSINRRRSSVCQDEELKSLMSKQNLLTEKFEDARTLKDGIETRRRQIVGYLARRLTDVEFADCRNLMKTKCRLNLLRHSIEDRTRLADEQMKMLVTLIEKKTASTYC